MIEPSSRQRIVIVATAAHSTNDASVLLLPTVLSLIIEDFTKLCDSGTSSCIAFPAGKFFADSGWVHRDRVNKLVLLLAGLVVLGVATLLVSLSANYIQLPIFQYYRNRRKLLSPYRILSSFRYLRS